MVDLMYTDFKFCQFFFNKETKKLMAKVVFNLQSRPEQCHIWKG